MEELIAELKSAEHHEPPLSEDGKVDWKLERVRTRLVEKLELLCHTSRAHPGEDYTHSETLKFADRTLQSMFGIPARGSPFANNLTAGQRAPLLEQLFAAFQFVTVLLSERARLSNERGHRQ